MMRAVYAGSFDPFTLGHLNVLKRGCVLFEHVVLAIGTNVHKQRALPLDVRLDLLRDETRTMHQVEVSTFDGLLVDYCRAIGAGVILRGLRSTTDLEFEFPIGLANMDLAPQVQTVFLLADPQHLFVSSSLVKEITLCGGDASAYVPAATWRTLRATLRPDLPPP